MGWHSNDNWQGGEATIGQNYHNGCSEKGTCGLPLTSSREYTQTRFKIQNDNLTLKRHSLAHLPVIHATIQASF
eukprot:COSAG02_NODE_33145_length_504_cov_5.872305_2_plen_73_part_01